MEQLKLYNIDMKYVRDLHNADDHVESVSPQIGKENRIFVGIVVTHNDRKYCIPLSHPKERHKNIFKGEKRCLDFRKFEKVCDRYNKKLEEKLNLMYKGNFT